MSSKTALRMALDGAARGEVALVGGVHIYPRNFDDGERGCPLDVFIALCWPAPSNELAADAGPVLDLPDSLPTGNVHAAGRVLKEILLQDALAWLGSAR